MNYLFEKSYRFYLFSYYLYFISSSKFTFPFLYKLLYLCYCNYILYLYILLSYAKYAFFLSPLKEQYGLVLSNFYYNLFVLLIFLNGLNYISPSSFFITFLFLPLPFFLLRLVLFFINFSF